MSEKTNVVVYGFDGCADCARLKVYLDSHEIGYTYKDIDDPAIFKEQRELEGVVIPEGLRGSPTIVIGEHARSYPDDAWLNEKLGITKVSDDKTHDVIIIGAGPAALSAALYTTREDIDTLLFEKGVIGGLAAVTEWVDNYPGFTNGVAGLELAEQLQGQAERFGAKIELGEVQSIESGGDYKVLQTTSGEYRTKVVLIATGSDYKQLGIPGEKEFYGRGVHFCATCDGAFYRDKHLVVVGGGNSAVQEVMFLTKFASKIDMLVRGDHLRASEVLQSELKNYSDKITVHFNTTTDEVVGKQGKVVSVLGTNKITGKKIEFKTDGVFVFIGLNPNTGFLESSGVELDESNFVKTDNDLMTNIEGIFCAGDVRSGATMQIASASGEGATAALKIREYLKVHDKQLVTV